MTLHQKRVTITAVDLSKVSENCCIVLRVEKGTALSARELDQICKAFGDKVPKGTPFVVLTEGETLTVEHLQKQPAPEDQDDPEVLKPGQHHHLFE